MHEADFTEDSAGSGAGTVNISGFGNFDTIVFTANLQTDGTDGSDYGVSNFAFQAAGASVADTLYGGDGTDRFQMGSNFGPDAIFGGSGGADVDAIDLSAIGNGITATSSGAEDGTFTDGNDTATFDDIEAVLGTNLADTLDGRSDTAGLLLDGGAGSDLIYGGSAADTLSTGSGEDTLYGGAGDDLLQNSTGNDTLFDGTGNDSLVATGGDDQLYGGDGVDFVSSSQGNDTVDGGSGDDFLRAGGVGTAQTIFGGTGNDDINTFGQNDTARFPNQVRHLLSAGPLWEDITITSRSLSVAA